MSASKDSQATCTRLRDLLRGLVYAPAAITTPPDAIKQVKKILRIGKPFEPLLVNPFSTAGEVPRISSVLDIRSVLDVFDALEPVTKLDDNLTAALSDSITACLQKYSAPIADWLEYILPSRGYVRLQLIDYALVLPPIGRILAVLFHYKPTVSKALSELPHLYMILFRLWFHLEPSLACLPQEHARDVYRCTEFAMRNAVRSPQYLQSSVSNLLDIQATDCALAVVKHHPRRFYKYAVRCIPRLIESGVEQNFVEARLNTIMLYAAGALKLQAYPREVVISIIEVLRAQQKAPGGHVAAVYAFQILFAIWVSADDDSRSLRWALREGAWPLILYMGKSEKELVTSTIMFVTNRLTQLSVMRAICPRDGELCSVGEASACIRPEGAPLIDRWLREHIFLLHFFFGKACSYAKCAKSSSQSRLRRCPCLAACYCSRDCQRADWLQHRERCGTPDYQVISGELAPLDAMFIMSCARTYMLRHAERLLADLARLDSMPPPPFKPEFYRVDIDFKDIMPCHQISAHPPDLHQFAELWCLVTATVHHGVEGSKDSVIRVMDMSMREFKDYLADLLQSRGGLERLSTFGGVFGQR